MLQYNGQTLAYVGDAVYELHVRTKLLENGKFHPNALHKAAIEHTNASGQYRAYKRIENKLTSQEISIINRGRNASSSRKPGKADLKTYKMATGLEALLGYLYLDNQEKRLRELLDMIF